ncbi:MAG: acyltransferase [Pseudohongiellaceae bacterium]|nr:acyltransferase [Pseudohongiellaceae bacterium]
MSYYSQDALAKFGFKHLGKNVKLSTKASVYDCEKISLFDNCRIDDFCLLSGSISIGRYVHVAPFCLLAGGEQGITMDDFSGLAYSVQVFSQSDDYSGMTMTNPNVDEAFKSVVRAAVHLGRHVIIGTSSIVFPGVDVAEGCAVGAMSLVTKSTEEWGIYVGNPARRIKDRKKDLLALESKFLEGKSR